MRRQASPPPRSPRARLLAAAAALSVALPQGALAGSGWTPSVPAGQPVIASPDLHEEEIRWVIEHMLGDETAEALPSAAPLPLDAPAFLDPLREEILLGNLAAYRASQPACKDLKGDVTTWLKAASDRAFELKEGDALVAQRSAQAAFECMPDAIPPAQVAQLMAVPGLISGYRREKVEPIPTDETVRLFQDVFVVADDAQLGPEHHSDIVAAFTAARELSAGQPHVGIPVPVDDLPGLSLWVDGVPAAGPSVTLVPGRHFVQLVDGRGRSRYGGTFIAPADLFGPPPILIPPGLLPPSRSELSQTLTITAVSGALPPPVQKAARAAMAQGDHPFFLLAISDPGDGRLIGLLLRPDGALTHERFEPRRPGCAVANWTTALFGLGAVAGAAIWAPSYFEKQQAIDRGPSWYSEPGHTAEEAALHDQRLVLGMAIGWGSVAAGALTLGAARAGDCPTRGAR